MSGEDSPGLAALGRIEANLKHLTRESGSQSKDIGSLQEGIHRIELKDERAHAELKAIGVATDSRLIAHEADDTRRFQEVHQHLREACQTGQLPSEDASRRRRVVKNGGLVVGGGAITLAALELLERLLDASR